MRKKPIGVFDSGVGGLTVLKRAIATFPNEDFIYLGDEARMPYGPRPKEEIVKFSKQIANYMVNTYDIKLLVIACNTASAQALEELKTSLEIPVIGVIEPVSKIFTKEDGNIGLIATQGTVNSNAYPKMISQYTDNKIVSKPEPELVQIAETTNFNRDKVKEYLRSDLLEWTQENGVQTLILGCTHFPILSNELGSVLGGGVKLVDPGEAQVAEIGKILKNIGEYVTGSRTVVYLTTGDEKRFHQIAENWLEKKIDVKKVEVSDL